MCEAELSKKQPIQRLEVAIGKFNDVAIPYHLELLKRHKNNVKRFQDDKNWNKVYKEQINAMRVVKQLKQLLYEMDVLRSQVLNSDISTFDSLTRKSRNDTIASIDEYLGLEFETPFKNSTSNEDEYQADNEDHLFGDKSIQLQSDSEDIERQKACLHAWDFLQNDLQQLHQLIVHFNKVVHDQGESVDRIEDNVEVTQSHVEKGSEMLRKASKYKAMTYPLAGAFIGSCVAGPIGFLAGLKIGGLSAIGGGLLGYTGGAMMKKNHIDSIETSEIHTLEMLDERQNSLGSTSEQNQSEYSRKNL